MAVTGNCGVVSYTIMRGFARYTHSISFAFHADLLQSHHSASVHVDALVDLTIRTAAHDRLVTSLPEVNTVRLLELFAKHRLLPYPLLSDLLFPRRRWR